MEEISRKRCDRKGTDGIPVACLGNAKLMERLGISHIRNAIMSEPLSTWQCNGAYAGHILISDTLKTECERSDHELKPCRDRKDSHADR